MSTQTTRELPTIQPDPEPSPQSQRFRWLAERVERWVGYYDVDELRDFLEGPNQWPGQREKALVLLALTGTDEAVRVLERFDLSEADPELHALHRRALLHARPRSDA